MPLKWTHVVTPIPRRLSFLGFLIAVGFYLLSLWMDLDLSEMIFSWIPENDTYELDELVLSMMVLLGFIAADLMLLYYQYEMRRQRTRVYHATLQCTQHILNNFLNQSRLMEITAEECGHFDEEVLRLFRSSIQSASSQLRKLDELRKIDAHSIRTAAFGPEYAERESGLRSYLQKEGKL